MLSHIKDHNQGEWLKEYDQGLYYDLTKVSSDESDAIVSDYSLSESDSSSRDDKSAKVVDKSILA